MLSRRSLITSFAALLAAPAIVRVGSLMPVKEVSMIIDFSPETMGSISWVDTQYDEMLANFWFSSNLQLPRDANTSTATEVAMRIDDYMRSLRQS